MLSMALDHVWQSTLFVAGVMLMAPLFRRQAARTRFWLWFAASVKFLIPFAVLSALGGALGRWLMTSPSAFAVYLDEPIAQMTAMSLTPLQGGRLPPTTVFDWQTLLLAVWLAGAAAFAMRWVLNWLRVRAVLRNSREAHIAALLPVRVTIEPFQPALVGVIQPRILLPRVILADLSPGELEMVLAHEVCHWRRRDHLWSPVHQVVEVLFWFHPLVWWLGARLNQERERACDEAVLAEGFTPEDYAASLIRVCALHLRRPQAAAGAMTGDGLKARIDGIFARAPIRSCSAGQRAAAGLALLLSLALPVTAGFSKGAIVPDDLDIIHSDQHPPSEAVLRRLIPQLRERKAGTRPMSKDLARAFGAMQMAAATYLGKWGRLQSLAFTNTDSDGYDHYATRFEHGSAYWRIGLAADGRTLTTLDFHPLVARNPSARPQPGTEDSLRRYIESIEAGKPNYAEMSPELAAAVYYQLPQMRVYMRDWGPFRSMTFLDQDNNGMDVYRVDFAHGFAQWRIARPNREGKIWYRNFWGMPTASRSRENPK